MSIRWAAGKREKTEKTYTDDPNEYHPQHKGRLGTRPNNEFGSGIMKGDKKMNGSTMAALMLTGVVHTTPKSRADSTRTPIMSFGWAAWE